MFVIKNHQNAGFSLIEILFSIVMTLLLVDGLIHFFMAVVKHHDFIGEKMNLLENSQFAEFTLRREIQTAGFCGCNQFNQLDFHDYLTRTDLPAASIRVFSKDSQILGQTVHPESDVLVIEKMGEKTVDCLGQPQSAEIKLNRSDYFSPNQPLIIADCQNAEIFSPYDIKNTKKYSFIHANHALNDYHGNAKVGEFVAKAFFIQKTHRKNRYGQPIRALYSYDLVHHRQMEWVTGVNSMVFFSGFLDETNQLIFSPMNETVDNKKVRLIKIILSLCSENAPVYQYSLLCRELEILIHLRNQI